MLNAVYLTALFDVRVHLFCPALRRLGVILRIQNHAKIHRFAKLILGHVDQLPFSESQEIQKTDLDLVVSCPVVIVAVAEVALKNP